MATMTEAMVQLMFGTLCPPEDEARPWGCHCCRRPTARLERYGHGGYLIKVVVMALAGEVTRELSPILSWSNNNYEI